MFGYLTCLRMAQIIILKSHNKQLCNIETVIERRDPTMDLAEIASKVTELLQTREPRQVDGVSIDLHLLPPFIDKATWEALGNALRESERPTVTNIAGDKYFSLRCDGTGFSKLMRVFRRHGIFPKGYSFEFADIMKETCKVLMDKFSGICGYTQSDEMTVLVAPASIVRGQQQPHMYNGRIAKLTSLAAATVTAHFNYHVQKLCQKHGIEYTPHLLATFDCRIGVYETRKEAVSLLLWRAYHCGVNGVTDAVYHCKGTIPGAKEVVRQHAGDKLKWLAEHSLLPLSCHQREGDYFVKRKVKVQAIDQKTGEPVYCLRSRIQHVMPGNVLLLCKGDALFPPNDKL